MAKEEITFKAEERVEKGSAAAGRLRRAGFVPAAINRISGDTQLLKLNQHDFKALLKRYGEQELVMKLTVGSETLPALMREIQFDVMTGDPIHVDFGEINPNAKIRVMVPIRLVGDPEGVRLENGVLQQLVRQIEVECLPADVVEEFTVDVSHLKLGESLFARQIPLDAKYTLVIGKERKAVATVAETVEEDTSAAEGDEAAQPEVIAKGKKDEEADASAPAKKK